MPKEATLTIEAPIKPCPFCGGLSLKGRHVRDIFTGEVSAAVFCTCCSVRIHRINMETAVMDWNIRVEDKLNDKL